MLRGGELRIGDPLQPGVKHDAVFGTARKVAYGELFGVSILFGPRGPRRVSAFGHEALGKRLIEGVAFEGRTMLAAKLLERALLTGVGVLHEMAEECFERTPLHAVNRRVVDELCFAQVGELSFELGALRQVCKPRYAVGGD
jgi:hypothetical protein